ncbi:MAG: hypothetical protein LH615_05305 [Ferruginibacter sp.]|nr:hypothetical protein [Ferruginibacter sp.]
MKAFFKKYKLEINILVAVFFIVAASIFWFQYLGEQKGRSLLRAIMFSIFAVMRTVKVFSIIAEQKSNQNLFEKQARIDKDDEMFGR